MTGTMKALIGIILWVPSAVFGCLWVDGTTIDGHIQRTSGIRAAMRLRQAMGTNPDDASSIARFGDGTDGAVGAEAEAVRQILMGKFDVAIELLTKLEKASPGRYSTASNLGTAYELKGDNVNALKWITTGIERNPESHHGTEWLHALILEAKVEAANHPDHPVQSHLLDLPERMGRNTPIPVHGKNHLAGDVQAALFYQLNERLIFVKPKDPYVADLLYSFALIEANLTTVENGRELLQLARKYGFHDESLLKQQEERFDSIKHEALLILRGKAALTVAFGILMLWYCYRRKWFFLNSRDYQAHKAALAAAKDVN